MGDKFLGTQVASPGIAGTLDLDRYDGEPAGVFSHRRLKPPRVAKAPDTPEKLAMCILIWDAHRHISGVWARA